MGLELVIAEKVFRDHVTSKRFLVVFLILLLLSLYGISAGISNYTASLDEYKNQLTTGSTTSGGTSGLQVPSILDVFQSMIPVFSFLGMVLGVTIGFDQISREKEEGSLKLVITCPLYRDAIINGKALGSVATLAFAMAATFLVSLAVIMFNNIVPGLDDLVRLAIFFLVALLYCSVFYAIGMLMSTLARNTSASVLYATGIMVAIVLFSLLVSIVSPPIAQVLVNLLPDGSAGVSGVPANYTVRVGAMENQVSGMLTAFSPFDNFGGQIGLGSGGIGKAILSKYQVQSDTTDAQAISGYFGGEISLIDSLVSVWGDILALIVETIVVFVAAYMAFMRMDI